MNEFDFLIALILFVGVIFGAVRGATKQLTGLAAFWLSLIISLWLYRPLTDRILRGVFEQASPAILESFAFLILMIIFTGLAQLVFIFTSSSPEEKYSKSGMSADELMEKAEKGGSGGSVLNSLAGLVVGFIGTTIWLSILLALMQYVLSNTGLSPAISNSMSGSLLVPYSNQALGYVYASVELFTPGQLPEIFSFAF